MEKVIRLSESDLTRIVKRVIKEQEGDVDVFASTPHIEKGYIDRMDRPVEGDIEYDESRTFGPDEYDDFMEYINNCDTRWCLTTKKFYDRYTKGGPLVVAKKRR